MCEPTVSEAPSTPSDKDHECRPPSVWANDLIRVHWQELLGHARKKMGPLEHFADELAADVIGDIAAGKYDSRAVSRRRVLPLAKRLIHFEALHRHRVARRRVALTDDLVDSTCLNSWERAHRVELQHAISSALRTLTPVERQVVEHCYVRGWRVSELADVLEVREATIWKRLSRARRSLRKLLARHRPAPRDE
jgi:RNA polymerase sigma factor (sigma-70 family)